MRHIRAALKRYAVEPPLNQDLFIHVRNSEKELLCHWRTDRFPPVVEGRIGLRHMWTRSARYRDFRVSVLSTQ